MTIKNDFSIASTLWYKIGGKVKYFLPVTSKEELLEAVTFVNNKNITSLFICGLGSNLIFSDEYFDGAVIQIAAMKDIDFIEPNKIRAFAGVSLDAVILESFRHNLNGLEWAGGLPGTVGAAVRGNVGAFGGEIKDVISEVEVIDRKSLKIKTLFRDELAFRYRHSIVKQNTNLIVITATCTLHEVDREELKKAKETYQENIDYRKSHHPLTFPNCGSVFKNITKREEVEKILMKWPDVKALSEKKWHGKISMGYIVKRLGLSGYQVGKAQISEKHANFIINLGDAKAVDVKTIIRTIQGKVHETFGFTPEVEVEIVT